MLNTSPPFFMQVPALMQKHLYTKHLPRIAILKAVCRFVVLLLSTFCSFSIFVAGVFFALATLLIIVSSSLTLHLAIEIKKTCLQWVSFPGKSWSIVSDARRSRCPIGLRFQEARSPGVGQVVCEPL